MPTSGASHSVREAIVAGIFYPDDPGRLGAVLDEAVAAARARRQGESSPRESSPRESSPREASPSARPTAILAPHAAFDYSLPIQAAAWSLAWASFSDRPDPDRVVVVAPSRQPGDSRIYLPEFTAFETPLGTIEVDTETCAELASCGTAFGVNDLPHLESHGIELQLPFLRWLFPGTPLVPVLASGGPAAASGLARALDLVLGESIDATLFVVSSNLAASIVAADAARRSDDALALVSAGAWRELAARDDLSGATALASLLAMRSPRGLRFEELARGDSSGHGSSGAERIVHYAAAAWFGGNTHEHNDNGIG